MRNARGLTRGAVLAAVVAVVVGCWLVVGAAAQAPQAQAPVAHKALKDSFALYNKEVVVVQGWVTTEKQVREASFKGYYLRDRFGDLILIRTTKPLPGINTEVRVKGVALLDTDPKREPYVAEEERESLKVPVDVDRPVVESKIDEKANAAGEKITPASDVAKASDTKNIPLSPALPVSQPGRFAWLTSRWIAGLSIAGLALLVAAFVLVLSRKKEADAATIASTADAWQSPYQSTAAASQGPADLGLRKEPAAEAPVVEDYKTVKAFKTTKVLPGRLIVLENQKETDVIHLSDQSGRGEIEIGRDSPDATAGIRIKDKTNTLSRHQARLMYSAATQEFKLLNLVGDTANPTLHNGRPMHENEAIVLKDGDVLGMGNVELKFRHK